MTRAPLSLQGRLLALVLALVAGLWVTTAAVTWFDARHELDELLDGHLAQAAALLVVQQASEIEDDGTVDAPQLHRYAPRVAFQVWHEGRLAMRSSNAPLTPMAASPARPVSGFETVQIDGLSWRVFAAHGAERDVQVFVGEQAGSRAEILRAVLRSTLSPLLLALPLLAAGVWWAVRRGTAPLRALGALLAERAPQSLQPVALPATPAEMLPLLAALNRLFERIAEMVESERRFTADAAHELRTPIAAIRAQAQVALAEGQEAARRHALRATLEGCDRAARLVDQLLTLSRLEAGGAAAVKGFDLAALCRRVVAEIAPRALDKGQGLSLDADTACPLRGDETLVAVLLRNLVDNAVRYSPPGARVEVALRAQPGAACFRVDDSGPGLADAEIARLGERFFRLPGAAESGSGLGWSIVLRIAAAQGAELRVQRSALGGLAVRVDFRTATP